MKIGACISELLYEHESVILPGFGRFSTRYIPARFIPEAQKVESPAKIVDFDPRTQEGDTPLIQCLADREKTTPDKVKAFLGEFVEQLQQNLSEGKKVSLDMIGVFSAGEKGDILFEPDPSVNYLEEIPGSEPVAVPAQDEGAAAPVEEPEATRPVEEPLPEPANEPQTMDSETRSFPPALKWIAFTVVPLLVLAIILALNADAIFGRKEAPVPISPVVSPPEEIRAQEAAPETEAEAAPEPAETKVAFDPEAEPPRPEPGRPVYYLVVGSFEDVSRARDLARQLRTEDSPLASVFMQTRQGAHRVCYGYYYDLAEAEALLGKVQREVNPDAWILHR